MGSWSAWPLDAKANVWRVVETNWWATRNNGSSIRLYLVGKLCPIETKVWAIRNNGSSMDCAWFENYGQ